MVVLAAITFVFVGCDRAQAGSPSRTVDAAIHAAARTYGASYSEMRSLAFCESRFNANAVNTTAVWVRDNSTRGGHYEHSSGLFQFLPSTWANTPFAGHSVFDARWNAQGAAWLWKQRRPFVEGVELQTVNIWTS